MLIFVVGSFSSSFLIHFFSFPSLFVILSFCISSSLDVVASERQEEQEGRCRKRSKIALHSRRFFFSFACYFCCFLFFVVGFGCFSVVCGDILQPSEMGRYFFFKKKC